MARAPSIAIEIGRRRVRALQVVSAHGRLTVVRAMIETIPDGLTMENPPALGAWLGDRLRALGIVRGRAVVVLAREHVGIKRLTLPTTDDSELPDMTRLAMQRDLPMDASGMIIDFVPVERGESSTTVLAVAAQKPLVDAIRQVARAAGIEMCRIGLTVMGATAITNTADDAGGGSQLIVDVSGDSVELTVTSGGSVSLSRCGEIPGPGDMLAVAETIVTEARRTWMTARLSDAGALVNGVVLIGSRKVCDYAAQTVGPMLKSPVRVLVEDVRVVSEGIELDGFWPLAGALLEHHGSQEMVNLAQPRRAPDTAAATRRRNLLAAGFVLVIAMSAYTLANLNLRSLRQTAAELTQAAAAGSTDNLRYVRDTYKLKHLNQWQSAGVDWLEHAEYLGRFAPPPDQLVLDSWTGTLAFGGVMWSKAGQWSAPRQLTIVLDGEARDRETADAFREALVKKSVYTTSSTGADAKGGKRMPFGFTYRLRTVSDVPVEHTAAAAQAQDQREVASR